MTACWLATKYRTLQVFVHITNIVNGNVRGYWNICWVGIYVDLDYVHHTLKRVEHTLYRLQKSCQLCMTVVAHYVYGDPPVDHHCSKQCGHFQCPGLEPEVQGSWCVCECGVGDKATPGEKFVYPTFPVQQGGTISRDKGEHTHSATCKRLHNYAI